MRRSIVFICSMALLLVGFTSRLMSQEAVVSQKDGVKILFSSDLEGLATSFVEAYEKQNSGLNISMTQIDVVSGSALLKPGEIALISKDQLEKFSPESARITVIGRQVYVPITHPLNPMLAEIQKQGLSPADFAKAYTCTGDLCWNEILKDGNSSFMHAYRIDDPSFVSYLSSFLETEPVAIQGKVMNDCTDVFAKVKNDKNAIGFCTLTQLQELQKEGHSMDVALIPVDLNGNGEMDHFEEIYGSVDDLSRGVWIGKYSGALYSRIFALASHELSENEMSVVRWMSSDGQALLAASGLSGLNSNEQTTILAQLDAKDTVVAEEDGGLNKSSFIILLIGVVLGGGLLTLIVLRILNTKRSGVVAAHAPQLSMANPYDGPGGYMFDRSHTWSYVEKDGNIRVGVDSFLQYVTGKITKVNLKSVGEKVKKGESVLSLIQDGKTLDVKSPITGIIVDRNKDLLTRSGQINESPYEQGWFYELEPEDWKEESNEMMTGDKYINWVKAEFVRLKDFVASVLKPGPEALVSMQEGGEIEEGLLKSFGPEAWEEFQTGFLRNK